MEGGLIEIKPDEDQKVPHVHAFKWAHADKIHIWNHNDIIASR